jgi:hypothetical protein
VYIKAPFIIPIIFSKFVPVLQNILQSTSEYPMEYF